jgi:hypothetical protein
MTAHEIDAYCDTVALAELKRQGAKEALKDLQSYLYYCGTRDECKDELLGLAWAIKSIDRRLADLEPAEAKGGAA